MNNTENRALSLAYETFVQAAIYRSEKGDCPESNFTLKYDDLRTASGRERLRVEFLNYVIEYFETIGAKIEHLPRMERFKITINLLDVSLSPGLARSLVDEWKSKQG